MAAPTLSTTAFSDSEFHGAEANWSRIVRSDDPAHSAENALSNAAASIGASARKRKSTIAGTSESKATRVCTYGAIFRKSARSNRSAGHGAEVEPEAPLHSMPAPVSHGSHAATNCSSDILRRYSPLNAPSFFTSKNADEWLTDPSLKSRTIAEKSTISVSPLGAQPSVIK